jgi:hypothetical protein
MSILMGRPSVGLAHQPIFNAAMATHDCMDAGGRATQEAKAEVVFQQPANPPFIYKAFANQP